MGGPSHKLQRTQLIWLLLALTIGMSLWTAMQDDNETDEIVLNKAKLNDPITSKNNIKRPVAISKRLLIDDQNNVEALQVQRQPSAWTLKPRVQLGQPSHNLFAVHSWAPPPPKLMVKAEPSPPVAPEAPFFYMGKLEEEGEGKQFFLMAQQKLFHVRLGEKINAEWRLDSEDDQFLQLTYLPLGLSQVLSKLKKQVNPLLGLNAVATANQ